MNETLQMILGYALLALIAFLIIRRLIKTARAYLGMKQYVKSAIKLDRKKFNGLQLIDKIKRKRKRHSNSFDALRRRGKTLVRRYLSHKVEELPVFVRYANGSLLKRANNKLFLYVKQDKKSVSKVAIKKGVKPLIELSNQFHCLDELINFLHHLPDAILEKKPLDIYIGQDDANLIYQIK